MISMGLNLLKILIFLFILKIFKMFKIAGLGFSPLGEASLPAGRHYWLVLLVQGPKTFIFLGFR